MRGPEEPVDAPAPPVDETVSVTSIEELPSERVVLPDPTVYVAEFPRLSSNDTLVPFARVAWNEPLVMRSQSCDWPSTLRLIAATLVPVVLTVALIA